MKHFEKLKLQNKYARKNKGFTVLELVIVMAIIAILLLITIPGLSRYIKVANHTTEIGIADTIYKSSISAVANEYVTVQSTRTILHNSPNNIYKLNANTPLVQDILSGVSNNVDIEVYSYTTLQASNPLPENPTNSWLVFVKSNNGIVDTTGTIYIVAPESMNCYSNGKFKLTLNSIS